MSNVIDDLIAWCDGYFLRALPDGGWAPRLGDYAGFVSATHALHRLADGSEASDILAWARGLLHHADFDAWECGASLIGTIARCGRLPAKARDAVITELVELIDRPIADDGKEKQAKTVAIGALGAAGAVASLLAISSRTIVADDGDLQMDVQAALEKSAGRRFATPSAAIRWATQQVEDDQHRRAAWAATHDRPDVTSYSPSKVHVPGSVIDHPTFGRGTVKRLVEPNKIEVEFVDQVRVLAHQRSKP